MTVKELIEHLKTCDENKEVIIPMYHMFIKQREDNINKYIDVSHEYIRVEIVEEYNADLADKGSLYLDNSNKNGINVDVILLGA